METPQTPQRNVEVKKTVIIGGHGENPNAGAKREKKRLPSDMRAYSAEILRNGGTAQELQFAKETLLNHGYRWNDDDPDRSYQEVMAIVEKNKAESQASAAEYTRQQKHKAVWDAMEAEDNRKRAKIQAELQAAQPQPQPRAPKMNEARMIDLNEIKAQAEAKQKEESKNPVAKFFKRLFG